MMIMRENDKNEKDKDENVVFGQVSKLLMMRMRLLMMRKRMIKMRLVKMRMVRRPIGWMASTSSSNR